MGNDDGASKTNTKINRINELYPPSNKYLILEDIENIKKSICKIDASFQTEKGTKSVFGTGFFIDYESNNYLLTNYHIIPKECKKIKIEIWDKSNISLNLNYRNIIYLPGLETDITIISLKSDEFDKIEYLFFDLNYSIGYSDYKNKEVFAAGYPKGYKLAVGSGTIHEIIDEYEFYHNCPTDFGSSGSPIILNNTLKVIGIHKHAVPEKMLNMGTFIGEAIKAINKKKSNNLNKNHINIIHNIDKRFDLKIKNLDNNTIYMDNNYYKKIENFNNLNNKRKKIKKRNSSVESDIKYNLINYNAKNEIICTYFVEENKEINLLFDFNEEEINNFQLEESKRAYNEARKIINGKYRYIYKQHTNSI